MTSIAVISENAELVALVRAAIAEEGWACHAIAEASLEAADGSDAIVLDGRAADGADAILYLMGKPKLLVLNEDETDRLKDWVADDFIMTPFQPRELLARLRSLVHVAKHPIRHLSALESSTEASLVVCDQLEIAFVNERGSELLGHSRRDLLGHNLREFLRDGQTSTIEDLTARIASGDLPRKIDLEFVHADGARMIVECGFMPLFRPEGQVVVTLHDVTQQRRTAQELVHTMEFLESLIAASVDAIVATDIDGHIILFNPSAERICGYRLGEVIGQLTLDDLLTPIGVSAVRAKLEAGASKERREPINMDLVAADGSSVPVQLSASLISEQDQPRAIVLIFSDMRDKLRAERRLQEAQKKLAFSERQAVLAELAGTAAHELNQPLTSMMAYAELLQRKSEAGSLGTEVARTLLREAERMADIVRKIGRITHYETTSYVGSQKIFDLGRASEARDDEPKAGDQ